MNPNPLAPCSKHRRLGVTALLLVGLVAALLAAVSVESAPEEARTQPVYLAYTTNNAGYLHTCG